MTRLDELPRELLLEILQYIFLPELENFALINHCFRALAFDQLQNDRANIKKFILKDDGYDWRRWL